MSLHKNKLADGVHISILLIIFLYCSANAYQNAYLTTLGVDASLVANDFSQTIYLGSLRYVSSVFYFILAALFFMLLRTAWNPESEVRILTLFIKFKILNILEFIQKFIYSSIFLLFVLVCLILVTQMEDKGKEEANHFIASTTMNSIPDIYAKINNVYTPMVFISCGHTHCAGVIPVEEQGNLDKSKSNMSLPYVVYYFQPYDFYKDGAQKSFSELSKQP